MKKQLLTIFAVAALSFIASAQDRDPNLIPCATNEAMEIEFKKDPGARARFELLQAQFQIEYQNQLAKSNTLLKVATPVYTVPVVFHIMGSLNVSDQTFENLISYINNDYGKTGTDVATIDPNFASLYVDAEIKFALAKKDPNGNCTNGVIRHDNENPFWSQDAPAYNYSGNGVNRWPTNKYLNIYIVDCISKVAQFGQPAIICPTPPGSLFVGGYTYIPGSSPTNGDAIVMLKNQLAQSNPKDSRTLSHEIGHWLNLRHTFGNSNSPRFGQVANPATSAITCTSDNIADTPPTGGYQSICTASGFDCSIPNIENIMDYSSCPKMFTQGQVTAMRTALASGTGGRNNLWSSANLIATGITPGYTCTPVADFKANKVNNCIGNSITFTSLSQIGTSGSVSWNFQGGSPAASTATSQVVSYGTPGVYSVTLTATNANGIDLEQKVSYINILNTAGGVTLPNIIDFEGGSIPSNINVINNNVGSIAWQQNTTLGANGTSKSIFLNNASATNTSGHIDIFETPLYDFSTTTGVTLSYYYSYAKRVAAQADTFKLQFSLDCGGSWTNILGYPTTAVMSSSVGVTSTTPFVPNQSQWIFKTHPSALLSALNNKPSVKFRWWFKSDVGVGRSNNIYFDQINLTGNVVTAITEIENSLGLSIYPNPTQFGATLEFNMQQDQKVKIHVTDIMGRILEQNDNVSSNDGNVKYIINQNGKLASGIYMVNIDVNGQRISKKLIIQ